MNFSTPTERKAAKPADEIYCLKAVVSRPGLWSRPVTIYKLGITGRDAEARIDDMKDEDGPKCEVVFTKMTPHARRLESKLHKRFARQNVNFKKEQFKGVNPSFAGKTEFFYLSPADVEDVRIAFGCDVSGDVVFHGDMVWFVPYTLAILLATIYAKIYFFP